MFEAYTEKARRVIFFARKDASDLGDTEIRATHLLLGLLREGQALFFRLKIPEEKLREIHEECVKQSVGKANVPVSVDMALDQEAKAVIARSFEEKENRQHKEVDLEHLLLAALHVPCKARDVLNQRGLSYEPISADIFKPRVDPPSESALDYT